MLVSLPDSRCSTPARSAARLSAPPCAPGYRLLLVPGAAACRPGGAGTPKPLPCTGPLLPSGPGLSCGIETLGCQG